jgi:hypothetical protein
MCIVLCKSSVMEREEQGMHKAKAVDRGSPRRGLEIRHKGGKLLGCVGMEKEMAGASTRVLEWKRKWPGLQPNTSTARSHSPSIRGSGARQ